MAIDARKIEELDTIVRNKILGQGGQIPGAQPNRVDLSKTLYTDFFPKNPAPGQLGIQNASFQGNENTPSNPRKTDIVSALLNRTQKNFEFFKNNPKWSADQLLYYALGDKIWNPTGLYTATIPGLGGIVPSSITLIDAEQVRKFKDALKKPFRDIYGGIFGKQNKNLTADGKTNIYTPERPYSKDIATFQQDGDKMVVNYRQYFSGQSLDAALGLGRENKDSETGEILADYDFDKYIDDVDTKNAALYPNKKIKVRKADGTIVTIDNTSRNLIDLGLERQQQGIYTEYKRVAEILFLESNIKVGTADEASDKRIVTTDLKKIFLYCGLEDKITENFNVSWNSETFLGASQKVHTYSVTDRTFDLELFLYADIKDITEEVPGEYVANCDVTSYKNKIEWIYQHCYPSYKDNFLIDKAPVIYVTLGNLFLGLPCIIDSVNMEWGEIWDTAPDTLIPIMGKLTLSLTVVHPETPNNNYSFLNR